MFLEDHCKSFLRLFSIHLLCGGWWVRICLWEDLWWENQPLCSQFPSLYRVTVSPLATWLIPGEMGLMGRPCTHESLGGKQGKPGGLVVQTPGAKCGDRGQVKRAPRAHRGPARCAPSTHHGRVRCAPWAEMDPANREYLTSQAIRGIWIVGHGCSPNKRYRRIWTCLLREVESSSSPIQQQAPIVKYPGRWWNVGQTKFWLWDIRRKWDVSQIEFLPGWNELCHAS